MDWGAVLPGIPEDLSRRLLARIRGKLSVAYLDLRERRFFTAIGTNSGAWEPGKPMVPTLEALRGDTTAFRGSRFWMYGNPVQLIGPLMQ